MAITPAFELFCKNGQKRRRVFSVENCIVHKNDWIRDRLNIFAGWKEERQREFFLVKLGVSSRRNNIMILHTKVGISLCTKRHSTHL